MEEIKMNIAGEVSSSAEQHFENSNLVAASRSNGEEDGDRNITDRDDGAPVSRSPACNNAAARDTPEDSPFFKYACSLSPIKLSKTVHVQTYNELCPRYSPPPTVFKSPSSRFARQWRSVDGGDRPGDPCCRTIGGGGMIVTAANSLTVGTATTTATSCATIAGSAVTAAGLGGTVREGDEIGASSNGSAMATPSAREATATAVTSDPCKKSSSFTCSSPHDSTKRGGSEVVDASTTLSVSVLTADVDHGRGKGLSMSVSEERKSCGGVSSSDASATSSDERSTLQMVERRGGGKGKEAKYEELVERTCDGPAASIKESAETDGGAGVRWDRDPLRNDDEDDRIGTAAQPVVQVQPGWFSNSIVLTGLSITKSMRNPDDNSRGVRRRRCLDFEPGVGERPGSTTVAVAAAAAGGGGIGDGGDGRGRTTTTTTTIGGEDVLRVHSIENSTEKMDDADKSPHVPWDVVTAVRSSLDTGTGEELSTSNIHTATRTEERTCSPLKTLSPRITSSLLETSSAPDASSDAISTAMVCDEMPPVIQIFGTRGAFIDGRALSMSGSAADDHPAFRRMLGCEEGGGVKPALVVNRVESRSSGLRMPLSPVGLGSLDQGTNTGSGSGRSGKGLLGTTGFLELCNKRGGGNAASSQFHVIKQGEGEVESMLGSGCCESQEDGLMVGSFQRPFMAVSMNAVSSAAAAAAAGKSFLEQTTAFMGEKRGDKKLTGSSHRKGEKKGVKACGDKRASAEEKGRVGKRVGAKCGSDGTIAGAGRGMRWGRVPTTSGPMPAMQMVRSDKGAMAVESRGSGTVQLWDFDIDYHHHHQQQQQQQRGQLLVKVDDLEQNDKVEWVGGGGGGDGSEGEELGRGLVLKRRKSSGSTASGDEAMGSSCKRCNCKKSKCLKLYCECFAAGAYCASGCCCQNCLNLPEYEEIIQDTRAGIEARDPLAFTPKIIMGGGGAGGVGGGGGSGGMDGDMPAATPEDELLGETPASAARHKRGCNCKRSHCLKKYCECYQAEVPCSASCKCEGCGNLFGTKVGGGGRREPVEDTEDEERGSCLEIETERNFNGAMGANNKRGAGKELRKQQQQQQQQHLQQPFRQSHQQPSPLGGGEGATASSGGENMVVVFSPSSFATVGSSDLGTQSWMTNPRFNFSCPSPTVDPSTPTTALAVATAVGLPTPPLLLRDDDHRGGGSMPSSSPPIDGVGGREPLVSSFSAGVKAMDDGGGGGIGLRCISVVPSFTAGNVPPCSGGISQMVSVLSPAVGFSGLVQR